MKKKKNKKKEKNVERKLYLKSQSKKNKGNFTQISFKNEEIQIKGYDSNLGLDILLEDIIKILTDKFGIDEWSLIYKK